MFEPVLGVLIANGDDHLAPERHEASVPREPEAKARGAHPTADGRLFRDLHAGDWLGGGVVVSSTIVPYAHDATYDVLPDSDTGTYFAGGVLVGSTLAKPASAGGMTTSCEMPRAEVAHW